MKIEDEAKAFQRKKAAEKKARQRAGFKTRPIVLQDAIHIPALVAMGLLRDVDIENDDAINEAYAAVIRHYCHPTTYRGRELGDWSLHEWASSITEDREWQEKERRHVKRLVEGGSSDMGINPDHDGPMPYIRRHGDNRPIKASEALGGGVPALGTAHKVSQAV